MKGRALTGRTRVAGVVGWPVAHSLSPRLHGFWLDQHEIDGIYVPFPVRPDTVDQAFGGLAGLGLVGVNVTVPHKEAALDWVQTASETARRVGAVNTIVVAGNRTLHGENTDGFGFLENLREGLADWQPAQGPAMVLGAGGSARAVCAALLDAGVPEILLANRSIDRARALARAIAGRVTVIAWDDKDRALSTAELLVNTTTLGMADQPPLEIDLLRLPARAAVTDLVYRPLQTPLLRAALRRGHPVVDGLGMLLHQARPGFAAWFGVEPAVTSDLRRFVLGE